MPGVEIDRMLCVVGAAGGCGGSSGGVGRPDLAILGRRCVDLCNEARKRGGERGRARSRKRGGDLRLWGLQHRTRESVVVVGGCGDEGCGMAGGVGRIGGRGMKKKKKGG